MSIERIQWLRDNFSDEIPDKVLHGSGNFKVRRNWWQGLIANLDNGLEDGVIPDNLGPEVKEFIDHFISEEFHYQVLTSESDIIRVKSLLDKILGKS